MTTMPPRPSHPLIERVVERAISTSRWLLAPIYVGLAAGLVLLLVKFVQRTIELLAHPLTAGGDDAIVGVLALVDLALMGSLVLMVMFAGYENFVLKLMASIVAISAIHVLESFMNVSHLSDRELAWRVGIHTVFVISGVLLAVMDRLVGKTHA